MRSVLCLFFCANLYLVPFNSILLWQKRAHSSSRPYTVFSFIVNSLMSLFGQSFTVRMICGAGTTLGGNTWVSFRQHFSKGISCFVRGRLSSPRTFRYLFIRLASCQFFSPSFHATLLL